MAAIDELTHENAFLKRLQFATQSEQFSAEQKSLLNETAGQRSGGGCRRD
ncbi:MAG: transposase [Burkholderiales bacterium]|nr:transposase [Burkholderiales bacterium]